MGVKNKKGMEELREGKTGKMKRGKFFTYFESIFVEDERKILTYNYHFFNLIESKETRK